MAKRKAKIIRKTKETEVEAEVNLDGIGESSIDTGIGFLNHMLELFSKHSLIDISLKAKGDLDVDEHHTVEDIGICLGQAIRKALGDKKYIGRYGFVLPMDESLAETAVDLGGRPLLVWKVNLKHDRVGEMPSELFEDFFKALADNLSANIHVNLKYGRNGHHMVESIFKSFAKSLRSAIDRTQPGLPSTKGKI
jgi:imidazoleglycerol phosphate dehydratase HisB